MFCSVSPSYLSGIQSATDIHYEQNYKYVLELIINYADPIPDPKSYNGSLRLLPRIVH